MDVVPFTGWVVPRNSAQVGVEYNLRDPLLCVSRIMADGTFRSALLPGIDGDQSCALQERDLRAFAKKAGDKVVGARKETASRQEARFRENAGTPDGRRL
jgi:hypothetical protein